MKRLNRTALGVGAVLLVGVVAALAAAEITLRMLDLPSEHPVGWAWRGDPAERNELGFRGHRASGAADDTVLLVGDSQVETALPFEHMPEVFLGSALRELTGRRTRVVSMGAEGWGQDQQLLALRRDLPSLRPRMVVLWFTPGNDVWNNTFPTHMPRDGWPKPTFWLEGDLLRGPHAEWGTAYRPPGPRLARAWRKMLGRPMYVTDAEWEAKLPPAYSAGAAPRDGTRSLVKFAAAQWEVPLPQMEVAFGAENFDNEKSHVSLALTPRSPRSDYSIRLTRALLREIDRLCRQHGATFLVVHVDTGPYNKLPPDPTRFTIAGRVLTLSDSAMQAAIRDVLADVPHVTLAGYQPRFRVSKLDAHLNAEGNRHFMTELARRLATSP